MFADSPNVAVVAAAGSRKTEQIIQAALEAEGRVLITTYTNENRDQIIRRIEDRVGVVPPNILIMGWFAFLISHGAKPFQVSLLGEPFQIDGLNFDGEPPRYVKSNTKGYFLDDSSCLYRKNVANFVVRANEVTDGAVVTRIGRVFTHILIDEVQDLVGWDLEVIDLLIQAQPNLLLVGDPRQCILATNTSTKNQKYRGIGLLEWLGERSEAFKLVERNDSYRCTQEICDFADALFPGLPDTTSVDVEATNHDGIFQISRAEVSAYADRFAPVVLRWNRTANTCGLQAMNIGLSKGSTYDRVLIFPTAPMKQYLKDRDSSKLKAPESLYVAVTRARYSVAFVV